LRTTAVEITGSRGCLKY